jgi:ribulose-bisphosphate carboxylase large chain
MAISKEDIPGFFAVLGALNPNDYILVDYFFETTFEPRLAAATICSEMSTAQWRRVGVEEDLREEYGAKAVKLNILKQTNQSKFNSSSNDQTYSQCELSIAYPIKNFGTSISTLLSCVIGEGALYCPGITTIKLMDLKFPGSYLENFSGPQFGVEGLRKSLDVYNRPFFIGVIKPNIGLNPEEMAEISYQAWLGGLDIAKDDEMLANPPWSKIKDRVPILAKAQSKVSRVLHKKKIYVANITDDASEILNLYKTAEQNGAGMVMINGFFTGLGSIKLVRLKSKLPILGHFTGMALWDHETHYGIEEKVLIKLQRILGCDVIVMPGLGERMKSNPEKIKANVDACLSPLGSIKSSLPVPGGSDWAGTLKPLHDLIGHDDFGFICGRGVFGHPNGPKSGAKSLHQAIDAIHQKRDLLDYATNYPDLMKAIKAFGSR